MASIASVPHAVVPINRLLRRKEVERIVGLGRAHRHNNDSLSLGV